MVQTVIYPKQCKEYHEAFAKEDWYAVNLWYVPPIYKSLEQIESEMRFNELVANFEAEQKFVDELPEELLETYIKMKFKIKEPCLNARTIYPTKKKNLFTRLFKRLFRSC